MDIQSALVALDSHPDYRVLRRFSPVDCYQQPTVAMKFMLVIDTETTGLDSNKDKIIEIGYVMARFDTTTGSICDVTERYSGLEDPGFSISPEITKITGITTEDVAGKHFDDAIIQAAIAKADVVVAHNAKFDRGFLERRYPEFASKWWACSIQEGPWQEMHTGSSKLEYLAYLQGFFYSAHRALTDAEVLLHVLTGSHDGKSIASHLLAKARQVTYRVWAVNSPYDKKDDLKKNGYRWSDGTDPNLPHKSWYKEGVWDLKSETEYLADVYETPADVIIEAVTGRDRYSTRLGKFQTQRIGRE